ncbi:hypothetical protein PYCC9005_003577 [Savitreella phatthalungensis]
MRQCLTNPESGYYSRQEPFGAKGDFVTSPEISQMFGELVGIHFITEWLNMGQPQQVSLVELGPGKGTLLDDALRAAMQFTDFAACVKEIHLIEASDRLREIQRQKLCGQDNKFFDADLPQSSPSGSRTVTGAQSKFDDVTIYWHYDIKSVPRGDGSSALVVAHEFFDALPIHAFEATKHGWRELLVDTKQSSIILPAPSIHDTRSGSEVVSSGNIPPTFHLTRANRATPHSTTLLQAERYTKLSPPARVEISPEALSIVRQLTEMLDQPNQGGSILIIDYGPATTIPIDTLRAIRKHKIVSPFDQPGQADLSVDVDFEGIKREALSSAKSVTVHGPVTQSAWLHAMGIGPRATILARAARTAEAKERVAKAYERLTNESMGMGKAYKVMAITVNREGQPSAWVPAGFQVQQNAQTEETKLKA